MFSYSFKPGEVPALVIFKTTKPGPGLLWLPSEAGEVNCSSGLQPYELGQWLLFNQTSGKVVRPLDTGPYQSTCYKACNENGDKFAQVITPVVHFSEKTLHNMVLYSQHFGKIGSLYKQTDVDVFHDKFQWADIAYMARYRDQDVRGVMQSLEVEWLVVKLGNVLSRAELKAQDDLGHFKFVSGLVVGIEEQRELCEKEGGDAGDENNTNDAMTNSSSGSAELKLWTAVNIWVAELPDQGGPGIAVHRFRSGQPDEEQRRLAVGQFCKLMPVKNWANGFTAVSAIVSSKQPKGFQVESVEPLKLRVMNDCYALDQNPDVPLVHVPNFLGPVQCKTAFVRELRRERQRHPLLSPRLLLEFKPSPDGGFWDACHFDGRGNSPPPPAERPAPPPAAALPMPPVPVKTGGFGNSGGFGSSRGGGRGQFNNFRSQPGYQSASTGSSSFNTSAQSASASSSANFPSKPAPSPARPAPAPTESTMTGGFGRSRRDVSSSRSITPVPIARSPSPPESNFVRQQRQQQQQGGDHSRPPSVSSDFAEDSGGEEEKMEEDRAEQQQRQPSPGHPPQPQQQFRAGGQARRGAPSASLNTPGAGGGGRRPSASASTSSSFLGSLGAARPQLVRNMSGIVVSKTDSSFFVYTSHPKFPNELRLPIAQAIPGLQQGSWIRFDAMENDPRVSRVHRVEQPTHPTRVVRNTVQVDCMGIVPARWNPQMSTFVPEINTDVVEKVIDSKRLLDKDYASAQLTVTIERGKPKDWPGYSWFISKFERI